MSSILYLIAVILLISWVVGVFIYSVTGLIHILLVFALVAIIFKLIGGR
ncbi:lmo0937 family membrane protein [Algoriphagus sp. D3-2-R+10]|nr:lmo0937 family membrane protein [Algoriphagus sp. D3-2-R+10]MEB2775558.1 lmo0937 family membrane protein [Algoriphagus sp. D3-2-R+10]